MSRQMGSCCVAGLGLVWYCYCIYMTFICLSQKKKYIFWIFEGPRLCTIHKYVLEKSSVKMLVLIFCDPNRRNWTEEEHQPCIWMSQQMGSCCVAGLGLVWYCYCIYMTFVCLSQKKWIYFGYLRGLGCVESKNKTSAKRKSTMSSLNPSIIQVGSFKCRAGVPLGPHHMTSL